MAGGVITAACIQAAPLGAAAFVAWFNLGSWREELWEKRRVDIAETSPVERLEGLPQANRSGRQKRKVHFTSI
jgi:hypothetical protein